MGSEVEDKNNKEKKNLEIVEKSEEDVKNKDDKEDNVFVRMIRKLSFRKKKGQKREAVEEEVVEEKCYKTGEVKVEVEDVPDKVEVVEEENENKSSVKNTEEKKTEVMTTPQRPPL